MSTQPLMPKTGASAKRNAPATPLALDRHSIPGRRGAKALAKVDESRYSSGRHPGAKPAPQRGSTWNGRYEPAVVHVSQPNDPNAKPRAASAFSRQSARDREDVQRDVSHRMRWRLYRTQGYRLNGASHGSRQRA